MKIINKKRQTVLECLKENNFSRKVIRSLDYVIVNDKEIRLWMEVNVGDILEVPIKEEKSDVIPTKGDIDRFLAFSIYISYYNGVIDGFQRFSIYISLKKRDIDR